jgi:hypothetical protein
MRGRRSGESPRVGRTERGRGCGCGIVGNRARRDVPEFVCDVDLTTGAAEVFADQRRRGKWKDSREDSAYQAMIDESVELGQEPQPA